MPDRDSVLPPYPAVQRLQGPLAYFGALVAAFAFSGLKMVLLMAGVPAAAFFFLPVK